MRSCGSVRDYFRNGYGKEGGAERPHAVGTAIWHGRRLGFLWASWTSQKTARLEPFGKTLSGKGILLKRPGSKKVKVVWLWRGLAGKRSGQLSSENHQTRLMRELARERLPHR